MAHYVDVQRMLVYVMSSKKLKPLLLIAIASLLSYSVSAQSIYQQSMLRLNAVDSSTPAVETLQRYQGQTLLTLFFMPDCRWCRRQHKVLKKMQKSCPKLNSVMLGVQGSKQKLRRELQRDKNTFPAYVANNVIVNAVGSQSPVPMMLIFDSAGQLALKTIGYTREDKLQQLLLSHNVDICPS